MKVTNLIVSIAMLASTSFMCMGQAESNVKLSGNQIMDTIILPKPNLEKGMPLMQALNIRKSSRSFSDIKISTQQLSELLWAANGVNRNDGKRTAPSAVNVQFVDIYVVTQEAVYLFDAIKHRLIPIVVGDFRKDCGSQDFVAVAALNLVYVANFDPSKKNARICLQSHP
jgi:hypothetical protein